MCSNLVEQSYTEGKNLIFQHVVGLPKSVAFDGECLLSVNKRGAHLCSQNTHVSILKVLLDFNFKLNIYFYAYENTCNYLLIL